MSCVARSEKRLFRSEDIDAGAGVAGEDTGVNMAGEDTGVAGVAGEGIADEAGGCPGRSRRAVTFVRRLPVYVLVGLLRGYQRFVSPLTGPTCKYYPSCSAYALTAIRRHGALRGTGLALWRLLRCNPWSLGGVDDVPPARHHH